MQTPNVTQINIKRQSRLLVLSYDNNCDYSLSFELLRVLSPSAEVKGHGPGQEVLQYGKEDVLIDGIETVGNYAIQIMFNDGHDSGIYSWSFLYELCTQQEHYWQEYLEKLQQAGKSRQRNKPTLNIVQTFNPSEG